MQIHVRRLLTPKQKSFTISKKMGKKTHYVAVYGGFVDTPFIARVMYSAWQSCRCQAVGFAFDEVVPYLHE
jgi:hypothetical protein